MVLIFDDFIGRENTKRRNLMINQKFYPGVRSGDRGEAGGRINEGGKI